MSDKVCIIGAGSSGIAALKALQDQGIACDCFELGSDIGGNWRYNNDNGRSSAYASLYIDTSKERMQYADLPMPAEYPNFPHHSQVLAYFEQFVKTFDLRRHVIFRTCVEAVTQLPEGGYRVITKHVDTGVIHEHTYRAVLVCNGHHWNPKMPRFPGNFDGEIIHSHYYREPEPFKGKRILILGIGNSGADITSEISRYAAHTVLAMRRNPRILPRYVMGWPLDKWNTEMSSRLPLWLQQFTYGLLLSVTVGEQARYGFPNPDHTVLTEHPTVSSELLNIVAHGGVTLKPNIARLDGSTVEFEDGSREEIEAIIYATGYQISFPFLDAADFAIVDNETSLYRHVVAPDYPGLYFIGLIQPLGAIMPLAEIQAQWVADLLTGKGRLPNVDAMKQEILREKARLGQRYVASTRHTIQVDYFPYKRKLEREIKASQARARSS